MIGSGRARRELSQPCFGKSQPDPHLQVQGRQGGIPRGLCASCPQAWHHRGCPAASRSSALPAFLQPARGSKIGLCSAPLSQSGAVICLNSRLFLMKVDGELWVEGRYFINRLGRVEASSSWRAPGGGRSPGRIRNPVPLGLRG